MGPVSLWLEAQQQDLYRKLKLMQRTLSHLHLASAKSDMICELLLMSLHASSTDMQTVAGRFGEQESRKMLPFLQQWFYSEDYRYAVWHGGQVLRAAKDMKPFTIRGFYAIIVYQASLALVMASVAARLSQSSPSTSLGQDRSVNPCMPFGTQVQEQSIENTSTCAILLNGDKTAEIEDYLLTGCGTPALRSQSNVELLSEADLIPSIMRDTFYENYANADSLPSLLDELLALIKDLSKTA